MGLDYDAFEWRLFMNSSSRILKEILLHHGNSLLSFPIGYSVQIKETHKSMDHLPFAVNYPEAQICEDLNVVGLVLRIQDVYTEYLCFLRLWDSLAVDQHYVRQEWTLEKV